MRRSDADFLGTSMDYALNRRCWFAVLVVCSCFFVDGLAWSAEPPMYHVARGAGTHVSLYPDGGVVQVLVGNVDYQRVLNDKVSAWIVEFYDQSCPHCWYFAAVYPNLAKGLSAPNVMFGAFNCIDPTNADVCLAAGVRKYPTLFAYNAKTNQLAPQLIHVHPSNNPDDPLSAKAIADSLVSFSMGKITITNPQALAVGPQFSGGSQLVAIDGPPGQPGWTHEMFGTYQARLHDAHIGFARLLMDGYVSNTQYQAALAVAEFVSKCLGKEEQPKFDALLGSLRAKPAAGPVEFKGIVSAWMEPFKTKAGGLYLFCTNKNCAVWQLFHAISLLIAINYASVTVAEALPQFRFMVDNFLSCDLCKHHFVTSYDACLFGRCEVLTAGTDELQKKALVMWLWRVHNAVSVRVLKENPSLNGTVDRRFPTYRDCPGCWHPNVVAGAKAPVLTFTGQTNNNQPVYDVFDIDSVYGFLKREFLGEGSRLYQKSSFRQPNISTPGTTVLACSFFAAALIFAILGGLNRRREDVPSEEGVLLSSEEDETIE